MNIVKGDKVVMTSNMERMSLVGKTFEVANITDNNAIVLRDCKTKVAVCAVSVDEFDKHFAKHNDYIGKWTPWNAIIGGSDEVLAYYKTNQRKVIVKLPDGVQSMASCNKKHGDSFNLSTGITLAFLRCRQKVERKKVKEAQSNLVDLKNQINRFINGL